MEDILAGWLLRERDEHTHIWCEETESGQILWSETTSRNRGWEEVSACNSLPTSICSTQILWAALDTIHTTPCNVAWKAVARIPMGLRNSEAEPLCIPLNPPRAECPISPRNDTQKLLQSAMEGQCWCYVLGLRIQTLPASSGMCPSDSWMLSQTRKDRDAMVFSISFSPLRRRGDNKQIEYMRT